MAITSSAASGLYNAIEINSSAKSITSLTMTAIGRSTPATNV